MKKGITFLFVLITLFACNNAAENPTDMSEFTEDEEFKNAHELPDALKHEGEGQMVAFPTADGEDGAGYLLNADNSNQIVLVIHEWYGLNDHIKQEADRLFNELNGATVIALDMYDGKVADNREDAGKYMKSVTEKRAAAIIEGSIDYLSQNIEGGNPKIGTIGWCFGGGWSLRASILAGKRGVACVMYYGMPVQTAEELAPIEADILGIFAEKDKWISPEVAEKFDGLAKATGKNFEFKIFDADHAFANPTGDRYVEEAAKEANAMATAFLKERLFETEK